MTDKEKIELIMQEKHLNNTQFCNEVCIAPGTLSHIRSGRTEPTLNILRSVSMAFPDINPSWLFYDEGEMYRTVPGAETEVSADGAGVASMEESRGGADGLSDSTGEYGGMDGGQWSALNSAASVAIVSGANGGPQVRSAADARKTGVAAFSVQDIVAETLRQQSQQRQRKVLEVRIFFDDGTFETFGGN